MTPAARRFSPADRERLERAKILGVRSGSTHNYTGVWLVMVEGRLFVRSWNDAPAGWYRAFRAEPAGSISVAKVELAVRARQVRSEPMRRAVTREATTLELEPA